MKKERKKGREREETEERKREKDISKGWREKGRKTFQKVGDWTGLQNMTTDKRLHSCTNIMEAENDSRYRVTWIYSSARIRPFNKQVSATFRHRLMDLKF